MTEIRCHMKSPSFWQMGNISYLKVRDDMITFEEA